MAEIASGVEVGGFGVEVGRGVNVAVGNGVSVGVDVAVCVGVAVGAGANVEQDAATSESAISRTMIAVMSLRNMPVRFIGTASSILLPMIL